MPTNDRADLGAMFGRIARALINAERPLLEKHGLTMWGYVVLSHLAEEPASTQLALATAIGYDKTRLIDVLDQLERDDLIVREPDPDDRRAHAVRITRSGAKRHHAVRREIRAMESRFLQSLPSDRADVLLSALAELDRQVR